MIVLTEIAEKLNEILNDENRPNNFDFVVATQGFHLDHIKKGLNNFIPVFIGAMGGEYDPIANLGAADYIIPISIYYPVRFKNDFYALNQFLVNELVGKKINWGVQSGYAISNISVAQFGEIQHLDLKEFSTWAKDLYQREINVMEAYMSMSFNLYLSTANSEFIFGNDATITLSATFPDVNFFEYNNKKWYRDENSDRTYLTHSYKAFKNENDILYCEDDNFATSDILYTFDSPLMPDVPEVVGFITKSYKNESISDEPIFPDTNVQSASEPSGEQILNTPESQGLPINTAYSSGFTCYVKNNDFYNLLIYNWFNGKAQDITFNYQLKLGENTFTRKCYLASANMPIEKGELITITFSFAKRVDD